MEGNYVTVTLCIHPLTQHDAANETRVKGRSHIRCAALVRTLLVFSLAQRSNAQRVCERPLRPMAAGGTCVSVRLSESARLSRSHTDRYRVCLNLFSSATSCSYVNAVRARRGLPPDLLASSSFSSSSSPEQQAATELSQNVTSPGQLSPKCPFPA